MENGPGKLPEIVGVDCATEPKATGLVRARWEPPLVRIVEAEPGAADLVERLGDWILASDRVLLALDAPLGWPQDLGPALTQHRAGRRLPGERSALFARRTDAFVHRTLGVKPLDVGADRIARTAHATLALLERLREQTRRPLNLAWSPEELDGAAVIEVYPLATLKAYGAPYRGYKRADQRAVRDEILETLGSRLDAGGFKRAMRANPDVLDAAVCAVAAADFLAGLTRPPPDRDVAEQEGWIWFPSSV